MANQFSSIKDVKMEYALAVDKKPQKEGKDFIYNATYSCVLNDKKDSGGIVELKITISRKIRRKEMNSITFLTSQMILSFIKMKYDMLENKIKEVDEMFKNYGRTGFFGGEPKIDIDGEKLTKEEYLQREIESITTINETINSNSEIHGTQAKKIITFKNFHLALDDMEDIE